MFRIDNEVPIPGVLIGVVKYPFKTMKPGQSFAITEEDVPRVRSAAQYWKGRYGMTFSIRRDPKNPKGFRCWRTS